jgi:hypothetical protein
VGLYARVTGTDPAARKLPVHRLGAALTEWATGGLTRQQVIDGLGLTAADVADVDALQAAYSALTQAFQKAEFLTRMHNVFVLCETGDYTEAKAKARLGF